MFLSEKLIDYFKIKCDEMIKNIYYYSEGLSAQYKNKKNFTNLCFLKDNFNVDSEWHFSAIARGKRPCDGTLKRLAVRAILQCVYENQITTPIQMYQWMIYQMYRCICEKYSICQFFMILKMNKFALKNFLSF